MRVDMGGLAAFERHVVVRTLQEPNPFVIFVEYTTLATRWIRQVFFSEQCRLMAAGE